MHQGVSIERNLDRIRVILNQTAPTRCRQLELRASLSLKLRHTCDQSVFGINTRTVVFASKTPIMLVGEDMGADIAHNQFGMSYREHFSHFSLLSVKRVFEAHCLRLFGAGTTPRSGTLPRPSADPPLESAEVVQAMPYIREWGGKFGVPVPELVVLCASGYRITRVGPELDP
ncbi:hypothetical protein BFN03_00955 [Rhodococcus sp. WMMA185]|uniref:hypothetical protein n=1 Tax=Rhodococcus sp. WMMA185 TaxID=679318 RepID=UPI000877EA0A|nr:hypothetical protein [Rhodococcus sp. WMMA185]AOW91737.1 hypothetical protein BFN03_00955 [Rhodococcus sp. WMMA185]